MQQSEVNLLRKVKDYVCNVPPARLARSWAVREVPPFWAMPMFRLLFYGAASLVAIL